MTTGAATPWVDRAPRAATATLAALLVAAVPLYAVKGRAQWFNSDEWWFLVHRDAGSWAGWFEPHQEHWVTLPALVYRLWWNLFGLQSYKPYLALAVAMHLVVVVLLWAVLRRIGTSPWIATVCAAMLLFFGPGSENVLWGFMITFTASLAFGLAQLLVADHDAPSPLRTVAALACGLGALMSSGLGLVLVGIVGLALLVRRGWRPALVQTAPLLVAYGAWVLTWGTEPAAPARSIGRILSFAGRGLSTTLTSSTGSAAGAVALVAVVVAGLGLTVWSGRRTPGPLRFDLAIPVALALGGLGFYLLAGRSRVERFGVEYATRGRFLYVALVLFLPLVAVAADALARRWRWATVPVVLVLLAGVPGNIDAISPRQNRAYPPALVLAVMASPALDDVPADTLPFPETPDLVMLSAGWVRAQIAAGRIPQDDEIDPDRRAEALSRLALHVEDPGDRSLPTDCPPLTEPRRVRIGPGRPLVVTGVTTFTVVVGDDGRSTPVPVGSLVPRRVSSRGPSFTVIVAPDPANVYPKALCG